MAKADGSILVDTNIETKKAKQQLLSLENRLSKFAKKASAITDEMRKMESAKLPTDEFAAVQKQIDDTTKKINALNDRMEKFVVIGGKTDSRAFKSMQYDLDQLTKTLESAKGEAQYYLDSGTAYKGVDEIKDSPDYQKKAEQLSEINAQMEVTAQKIANLSANEKEAAASADNLAAKGQSTASSVEEMVEEEERVKQEADQADKSTRNWLDSFKSKAKTTGEKVSGLASKLKSAVGAFKSFHSHGKKGSSMLSTFGSRLKGIALSMFVFNWITKGWNAMISAIRDGTQNIAKYSTDVNAKVSQLTSAVATLKNAFAAMAAPIISAVAPAITQFINMITAAINKINQFISALTGKGTWIKATKQVKNYASGVDSAAKAAKKLNGQLQSFDELNNLSSNSDSGGGSGSGGSVGDMFSTEKIDPKIASLADKIKEVLATDDWSVIGEMIGKKVNSALKNINWDNIQSGAKHLASGIATLLNGFIKETDWQLVGGTIAEGINTAVKAAQTFVHKFDWKSFGKSIGDTLTGFINKFDWNAAGDTLGTFVTGLFDTLNGIFYNTDWKKLGNGIIDGIGSFFKEIKWSRIGKSISGAFHSLAQFLIGVIEKIDWKKTLEYIGTSIADFFKGIDWKTIASDIGELLGTALKSALDLATAIGELVSDAAGAAKEYFQEKIEECGGNIVEGILKGIVDAVVNIGTWIKKNILTPFINGFKEAFGIHSPAKKMKPIGKNIFLGIIEGWKEKIASFSFSKYAKELFAKIKKGFSGLKDDYVEFKAKVKDEAKEWWQNTQDYWSKKVGSVKDFTTNVKNNASTWWKNTQIWWKSKVGKAKEFTTDVKNQSGTWWRNAKSYWNDKVGEVKKFTTDVKKDGKKWWKNVTNEWSNTTAGKTLTVAIGFAKNALNNLWSSVTGFFGGKTVSVGTKATKKATGGIYTGGMWHNIAKYALGTENAPAGQLFIAREAGPELVGTIGGHTSVVNNDQIVASVSDGVARAVRSVIGTNGSNVNVTFKVEGDPNGIFRVTQQKANEYFRTTGNPAFEM